MVESLRPGANISEVARRNGLSPQQLFAWRRRAHTLFQEDADQVADDQPATAMVRQSPRRKEPHVERPEIGAGAPAFVPVVIAASSPPPSSLPSSSPPAPGAGGGIEITIGDAVVRIIGQVEAAMLVAVLRAVRRSS